MRQNITVSASSREAMVGVCRGWVIRGSFRRGVGWPLSISLNPRNTHLVGCQVVFDPRSQSFGYLLLACSGAVGEELPLSIIR